MRNSRKIIIKLALFEIIRKIINYHVNKELVNHLNGQPTHISTGSSYQGIYDGIQNSHDKKRKTISKQNCFKFNNFIK